MSPNAASVVTVAHGLGASPKQWQAVLRCKVANYGYLAGDEVDVTNGGFFNWYTNHTSANATTITFVTTNAYIYATRKDNPSGLLNTSGFSSGEWVLILRAWL